MALHIKKMFSTLYITRKSTFGSLRHISQNVFNMQTQKTDNEKEIEHHGKLAGEWWNIDGPMRALHAMNSIRVPFIRDGLVARGQIDSNLINTSRVLKNQKILDVGCGGGILSEQLARLGATVTGIDLGEELIRAAQNHLQEHSKDLIDKLTYKVEPVDIHPQTNFEVYDAVVLSEVIEHVVDKVALLTSCVQALKPGGSIFITTINKTIPMWIGGVLLSEYVLNITPKGTHHWDKMVSPIDLQRILDTLNCQTVVLNGSTYDFWRNTWRWIDSTSLCFSLQAVKGDHC